VATFSTILERDCHHLPRAVNGARVPARGAGPADPEPPRRAPTTPSATPAQSQPASSRPGLPRRAPTSRASAASPRSQLYIYPARAILPLWTDSSGNEGLGGYHHHTGTALLYELTWSSALSKLHPCHHRHKHMNYKEMLAMLTAFRLWLPSFSGKRIAIHTDNTALYHGQNTRSIC
jgi:hypothetical protein